MTRDVDILQRVMEARKDIEAADRLIIDYMPFIKSEKAKATGRISGEDGDDELSIAMMAFHEAIESYDSGKGAFLTFAALVIKRRIIDYGRKEKKFSGHISLSSPVNDDESVSLEDTIESGEDAYGDMHDREALKHEIAELTAQLSDFGITLTDVAENCPRQERTLKACREVLFFAMKTPGLIGKLKETGKLPVSEIHRGCGVEKKTLERHRKYIVTLLLIYSNGYDSIRDHLKQIFTTREGGARA